jgi:hypothetical protein
MDFENEAIFSGNSMAFHNLGHLLNERGDFRQMSGKRPDSDKRGDLMSRRFRIQFETITGDHTTPFQTSNTLLRCRIGHPNLSGQLSDRHPWISLQEFQYFNVFVILHYFFNIHYYKG